MPTLLRQREAGISPQDAYGCVDWFDYDAHPLEVRGRVLSYQPLRKQPDTIRRPARQSTDGEYLDGAAQHPLPGEAGPQYSKHQQAGHGQQQRPLEERQPGRAWQEIGEQGN